MAKRASTWKNLINFESDGQPDPDWIRIWTLGYCTTPKSGFNLRLFSKFKYELKIGPIFWSYQPNYRPWGSIPNPRYLWGGHNLPPPPSHLIWIGFHVSKVAPLVIVIARISCDSRILFCQGKFNNTHPGYISTSRFRQNILT